MTSLIDKDVIDTITCPITGVIMTDPVQGNDGQTYERCAILKWLSQKQTSPMTNEVMTTNDLKVNAAIRYLCDKYHSSNNGSPTIPSVNLFSQIDDNITGKNIKSDAISYYNNKVLLTFNCDQENDILSGVDLIMCIDRSGSMSERVEAKDDTGNNIENGFTQQDIVNHAAKTVAKTLNENDRLSIVAFDNMTETVFDLLPMTAVNINTVLTKISKIKPRGQTNIWLAIETAYGILDSRIDKTRNTAIMLLTDGVPNISPARGEIDKLNQKQSSFNIKTPIYTFGFGYSLKRELLYELARLSNGSMGHIPDGGMIATVFTNFIATIKVTYAQDIELHIKEKQSTKISKKPVMGVYEYTNVNDETIINIGNLQFQQSRDIIINFDNYTNDDSTSIEYYYWYSIGNNRYKSATYTFNKIENDDLIKPHIARLNVVESIRSVINKKKSSPNVDYLYKEMVSNYDNDLNDAMSQNILTSINDQVYLALSNEPQHMTLYNGRNVSYYNKWGEFYLDQLSLALNYQIKPNFKDTACYTFGGKKFNEIVDYSSDIFDNLPPPEPSSIVNRYAGGIHSIQPMRTSSLAAYNSQTAPCFHGDSLITLVDGTIKPIKTLKKNDVVLTIKDTFDTNTKGSSVVKCVLETVFPENYSDLVSFDCGLKITPWHPILTNDGWKYPEDVGDIKRCECKSVFSILLENDHIVKINDVYCITLAHNYKNNKILNHPYYGTNKIVDDLMNMPGYDIGHIRTLCSPVERDNDGKVTKLNYVSC